MSKHGMVKRAGREVVTVEIYKDTYDIMKKTAEENRYETKTYINEILVMNIEKDQFLKKYAPYLEKVGFRDNVLILKDSKKVEYIEVFLKNDKLYCSADEDKDCMHIHFALAMPELGRLKSKNK